MRRRRYEGCTGVRVRRRSPHRGFIVRVLRARVGQDAELSERGDRGGVLGALRGDGDLGEAAPVAVGDHQHGVAVQVEIGEQTLKPGFHLIGSRDETMRFQAMGRSTAFDFYSLTEEPAEAT
jgi:hypothetical protein